MGRKPNNKRKVDRRSAPTRAARQAAVQALYEVDIADATFDSILMDYLHNRWSGLAGHTAGEDLDRKKFSDIVKGVSERRPLFDKMVSEAFDQGRQFAGLDVLLAQILRAGAYELLAEPKVPARVIIAEYVGITHAFYAGQEPTFVNGVLDRIARVVRAEELGIKDASTEEKPQ
jgi:N utilization substance protein B